ncbi:hypothetical protein C4K14_2633 [Pseudomonas chlororaphis subsp. aureofaciens]|nr:hypothetical protein C4K14_2633 [Pseudomonas chlororaphis subsp. aureofaciens]
MRKPHENPALGVLLCASKDDEVVEYALNRSLSSALIAEYQTQLPDKKLLQAKLHELYAHQLNDGLEPAPTEEKLNAVFGLVTTKAQPSFRGWGCFYSAWLSLARCICI